MHRGQKKALINGFFTFLRKAEYVVELDNVVLDEEQLSELLDEYLPTDLKEMSEAEKEMAEYAAREKEKADNPMQVITRKDSMLDGKELGSFADTGQMEKLTVEKARETLSKTSITEEDDEEFDRGAY